MECPYCYPDEQNPGCPTCGGMYFFADMSEDTHEEELTEEDQAQKDEYEIQQLVKFGIRSIVRSGKLGAMVSVSVSASK